MIYLIIASILWGSSFPVISHALNGVSPLLFVCLRYALAFAILAPVLVFRKQLQRIAAPKLILLAVLNAIAFILQFKAQEMTTASRTALFINSNPIFIICIGPWLIGEKPKRNQLLAFAMAFSGILMVSTHLQFTDLSVLNWGDGLNLISAAAWSLFIMLAGQSVKHDGMVVFNAAVYFWTALMTAPLILFEEVRFEPGVIPFVAYLVLFSTVLAYYFYARGIQTTSALSSAIIFTIEVLVAAVISYIWLGERFITIEIIGFLLVIAGVVLLFRADADNQTKIFQNVIT